MLLRGCTKKVAPLTLQHRPCLIEETLDVRISPIVRMELQYLNEIDRISEQPYRVLDTLESLFAFPSIDILKPNNIILPKITTGLHLDNFQWNLPRVLQPVLCSDRDKGGFVL